MSEFLLKRERRTGWTLCEVPNFLTFVLVPHSIFRHKEFRVYIPGLGVRVECRVGVYGECSTRMSTGLFLFWCNVKDQRRTQEIHQPVSGIYQKKKQYRISKAEKQNE